MLMNSSYSVVCMLLVVLVVGACSPGREHVTVSGPIQVPANQRVSIKAPSLLHTPNYWNSVCLLPENPTQVTSTTDFGFVGQDGKKFTPKVSVRSMDGDEDQLPISGDLGNEDGIWLCFQSAGGEQKLHSPYSEVIVSTLEPMYLKAIKWHSSDK